MSYIDFKSVVKKVNLKPKGVKEIVLEINDKGLDGKLDRLSEMIDCKVDVSLESLVVNYSITLNARTERPLKEYKVDDKGVVKEVEPEAEQLEADLGLPFEKIKTIEEQKQTERNIVDEFILSGMAPTYDDLPKDFANIFKRRLEGESYSRLASELQISSGKIVELMDDYRARVAPLAEKWWEWKEGQEKGEPKASEEKPEIEPESSPTAEKDGEQQDNDTDESVA
ncbi:hypothetical protein [Fictibacillus gelatini]|uniref:hypothetical protein n=1 Tax=Fictibacillus gelatini TaxID=225985 RepID=UPI0003FF4A76|nr:hypothetical protein [Fictibacillus gelatini]